MISTHHPRIPAHLLWEYDLAQFDYDRSRSVVVIRVVQRGDLAAWHSIFEYYGEEEILRITQSTRRLDERDKRFVRLFIDSPWVKRQCATLHTSPEIIPPETLVLLQRLQDDPPLSDFVLVGGTALALQIGHRSNANLTLSAAEAFDEQRLLDHLNQRYAFRSGMTRKGTLVGTIDGVKTDFITHAYRWVEPPLQREGLRLASLQDIAAMKLNAISVSGERIKDYIDLYYLLERFSLEEMVRFYQIKYPQSNRLIPLRAITYLEDIDPAIDPVIMVEPLPSLPELQARMDRAVAQPRRLFSR